MDWRTGNTFARQRYTPTKQKRHRCAIMQSKYHSVLGDPLNFKQRPQGAEYIHHLHHQRHFSTSRTTNQFRDYRILLFEKMIVLFPVLQIRLCNSSFRSFRRYLSEVKIGFSFISNNLFNRWSSYLQLQDFSCWIESRWEIIIIWKIRELESQIIMSLQVFQLEIQAVIGR